MLVQSDLDSDTGDKLEEKKETNYRDQIEKNLFFKNPFKSQVEFNPPKFLRELRAKRLSNEEKAMRKYICLK